MERKPSYLFPAKNLSGADVPDGEMKVICTKAALGMNLAELLAFLTIVL